MIYSFPLNRCKHLISLRTSKRYRREKGAALVIGCIMVEEARARHLVIQEYHDLPESLLRKITGQPSPDGALAEIRVDYEQQLGAQKWVVVLDGIQDPGNLGTLIRTAVACGWEAIVLTGPCADPYSDKALRASMGAVFRLPLIWMSKEAVAQLPLVAADAKGKPFTRCNSCVLVLGSEGQGVSEEFKRSTVSIPMKGDMESLNVAQAGAILLYGLR